MSSNTYVVIMAGGVGSRFWPFSRNNNPKQFHDVLGIGESMIQTTVKRFNGICPPENVFIVANRDYRDLLQQHLPDFTEDQLLLEPVGRNTAPCIAYACYKIAKKNPNANIIVAPSDHVILREEAFKHCIQQALDAATNNDILVTIGIKPTRPDTGYGYIQFINDTETPLKKVKTFTEKPNLEIAQMFVESGEFFWNAGIFIWSAQAIIKAFRDHLEELADLFQEGSPNFYTPEESSFIDKAYSQCRNVSIDYGIMEKAKNVFVILGDLGWSDLGTWNSLYSLAEKNEDGNVVNGNAMLYNVQGCIIKTPSERLVVVEGLQDYIVAEHDNVLMICRRSEEQKVKDFVSDTKSKKGAEYI